MMFFACTCCAQPVAMTALYAWVYSHPVCSEECLARAEIEGSLPPAPSPTQAFASVTTAIDRAYTCLLECGRGDIALSRVLETHSTDVAVAKIGTGVAFGVLGSVVAAGVVDDGLQRLIARQEDAHWALEQHLSTLTRALMSLHGLGYPIAGKMTPLFTHYASIEAVGTEEAVGQLQSLRALIEELGRDVHAWLNAG